MAKEIIEYNNITPAQIDLIKSQIAVGATDDELKLFLHVADKAELDPLQRQIYFIKRGTKMTIQTGIDGFRTIADRTGQYVGSDDPVFSGNGKFPEKATVTVRKVVQNIVGEFSATARWTENKPDKNSFMWDKMPYTMLGKCAEALALRKAFPAQLSGLYTDDEMDQASDGNTSKNNKNSNIKTINKPTGAKALENILTIPTEKTSVELPENSNSTDNKIPQEDPDQYQLDVQTPVITDPEEESKIHYKTAIKAINKIVDFDLEGEVTSKQIQNAVMNNQHRYSDFCKFVATMNEHWEKQMLSVDYASVQEYCREVKNIFRPSKETV